LLRKPKSESIWPPEAYLGIVVLALDEFKQMAALGKDIFP
jgi:hypothetical protein